MNSLFICLQTIHHSHQHTIIHVHLTMLHQQVMPQTLIILRSRHIPLLRNQIIIRINPHLLVAKINVYLITRRARISMDTSMLHINHSIIIVVRINRTLINNKLVATLQGLITLITLLLHLNLIMLVNNWIVLTTIIINNNTDNNMDHMGHIHMVPLTLNLPIHMD